MAKEDENDSTEPTSPMSSTPDDRGDPTDGRAEQGDEARVEGPELTSEQAEYASDDADPEEVDGDEGTDGESGRSRAEDDLVPVGAARTEPVGQAGSRRSTAKKDDQSPKQRSAAEGPRRTSPPQFIRQSVAELRKVVYPTGQQLLNYFVVVLIFVLFIIAVVSLLDLAFGWVILRVFS